MYLLVDLAACMSVSMPFPAICDWLGQVQYNTAQVGAELQEIIVHRDIGPSATAQLIYCPKDSIRERWGWAAQP
jgi:hypothetical protein